MGSENDVILKKVRVKSIDITVGFEGLILLQGKE
jgi:hypothetical protein